MNKSLNNLASLSRAAQRKQELLQIEREQRLEDAEALKMTEEQRQILLRPFVSVKVEFSDLDGLSWRRPSTQNNSTTTSSAAVTMPPASPVPPAPAPIPISHISSRDHAFVVLTNADLARIAPGETIRASAASRTRPRCGHASPNHSCHRSSSSSSSPFISATNNNTTVKYTHSKPKPKPPVKGLFPPIPAASTYDPIWDSDSDCTVKAESDGEEALQPPRKERKKNRSGRKSRHASGTKETTIGDITMPIHKHNVSAISFPSSKPPAYITYSTPRTSLSST